MEIKGIFKNSSFFTQVIILLTAFVLGSILSSVLFSLFVAIKSGFSIEVLNGIIENPESIYDDPNAVRVMSFFSSVCSFFLPAVVLGKMFSDDEKVYLKTDRLISSTMVILIVVSMLALLPFLNLTAQVNEMMRFPEALKPLEDWMRKMEDDAQSITQTMLLAQNWKDVIFNIVILGVFAGVGEELIFRGVLQNIFRKIFKNEHVIIWVVAVLFSAIHMQFYGFIPRLLMGVYFGYLLFYTKSIWAPILAHFTNNTLAVFNYYGIQDPEVLKQVDSVGTGTTWWIGILSLLLWLWIFLRIIRLSKNEVNLK